MAERQWIDWQPKAGDIKPEVYRIKVKHGSGKWRVGACSGDTITQATANFYYFQVPYRECVVKLVEDRPPWIDPQCKFRWGDRVKTKNCSRVGSVAYVIHPNDTTETGGGDNGYTVLVARFLGAAVPYETADSIDQRGAWSNNILVDKWREQDTQLFPEDLPQHFDDRILDVDQPQEQPKTVRVPREIWVNMYPDELLGYAWLTKAEADSTPNRNRTECVHFREVL